VLLSSKFAAQVLIGCLPVVAVATGHWDMLAVPVVSVVVALAVSKGRYWHVLSAHVTHLRFYRRRLQYEHVVVAERNRLRTLLEQSAAWLRSGLRSAVLLKRVAQTAEQHTLVLLLSRNILWSGVVIAGAIGSLPQWSGAGARWERWLWWWMLASAVPFFISSLRPWRFLGEAERYLEFAVAPAALLGAVGLVQVAPANRLRILVLYLVLNAPVLLYTWFRKWWQAGHWSPDRFDELVRHLRDLPAGSVLLPIPMTLAFQVAYLVEHRFLSTIDPHVWARSYDRLFERYPWPTSDLAWWRDTYGARFVVADVGGLAIRPEGIPRYQLDTLPRVFHNGAYAIYALT
jgi:hypothetical protein